MYHPTQSDEEHPMSTRSLMLGMVLSAICTVATPTSSATPRPPPTDDQLTEADYNRAEQFLNWHTTHHGVR